jgi:hypothetical protein
VFAGTVLRLHRSLYFGRRLTAGRLRNVFLRNHPQAKLLYRLWLRSRAGIDSTCGALKAADIGRRLADIKGRRCAVHCPDFFR